MKRIMPIDNYRIVCDFQFSESFTETTPIDHLSIRDNRFRLGINNNFSTYKEAVAIIEKHMPTWKESALYSHIKNIRIQHSDCQWYELTEADKITWHEKELGH